MTAAKSSGAHKRATLASRAPIAVDAMGSDAHPIPEIEGVVAAVRHKQVPVMLVGDQARVRRELERLGAAADPLIQVRHTSEVITMDDHPAQAARRKKDSSLRVCFDLVAAGQASAVVSAGNSGAFLACALFVMKRTRGCDRPGILASFPNLGGRVAVLDVGANVDIAKAEVLAQFAALGAAYVRVLDGKLRPRVAVLSNGEEAHKGSALTRAAHAILSRAGDLPADFEYVGYCEGNDIFKAPLDVVVTDGFTGNAILKTTEGLADSLFKLIRVELTATRRRRIWARMLKPAFAAIKKKTDWAEYGGAPLLGVDGVAIVCHGRSTPRAIESAVYTAQALVSAGLGPAMTQALAKHAPLWAAGSVAAEVEEAKA